MVGKAEKRGDIVDSLKAMQHQNQQNYGLSRAQDVGAPKQRSYSIGTADNDPEYVQKLDIRGGVMLGSLAYAGVATEELAVSGIIDTSDYNSPRIYITNTALNTLKVLVPTITDGQEIWVRANAGVAFTIQNTAGTGNETTGNIECMAGTDYTMTSDDWICFHYDNTDLKFHQVTAGKNNIGGGSSGEVFTWTNNHSAANNSLTDIDDLDFTITTANDAHINTAADGFEFRLDSSSKWFEWWQGGLRRGLLSGTQFSLFFAGATEYEFTAISADWHSNTLNNAGGISLTAAGASSLGIDFGAGLGNTIKQISGDFYFQTKVATDQHKFYCGSEYFRVDGANVGVISFVPMQTPSIGASVTTLQDGISFTGGIGGLSLNTVSFTIFAGSTGYEFTAGGLDMDSEDLLNVGLLTFISTSLSPSGNLGITSSAGNMGYHARDSNDKHYFKVNGAIVAELSALELQLEDGVDLEFRESTTPPSGSANGAKLFAVDSGGGKTILKVQFGSGSAITLATEV